MVYLLP